LQSSTPKSNLNSIFWTQSICWSVRGMKLSRRHWRTAFEKPDFMLNKRQATFYGSNL
jgi:hypothetical protein